MKLRIWDKMREFTQARVGLHRTGHAVGTREILDFQMAHALARDAIHAPWDLDHFQEELSRLGLPWEAGRSAVSSREEYLKRPDLGRTLDPKTQERFRELGGPAPDVLILVTNGLSSFAINKHSLIVIDLLMQSLRAQGLSLSPVFLIPDARVALIDELGEIFRPRLGITLLGERPGLSSPDSLGAYLTYAPRRGKTDADRNCVSNIREPHGLPYHDAVHKMAYLAVEALNRGFSGVALKDESERGLIS